MMQIDRNIIIKLLSEKPRDGVSMMTVFKGESIVDMTDEELTILVYFIIEDHHKLMTLLEVLTKSII